MSFKNTLCYVCAYVFLGEYTGECILQINYVSYVRVRDSSNARRLPLFFADWLKSSHMVGVVVGRS